MWWNIPMPEPDISSMNFYNFFHIIGCFLAIYMV